MFRSFNHGHISLCLTTSFYFLGSQNDCVHVVIDRHVITGQNDNSTLSAVQNLILLCNARYPILFALSTEITNKKQCYLIRSIP